MHDNLTDLPEAVPLHRVSPAWRLIGIFASIMALLCLFGFTLLASIARHHREEVHRHPAALPAEPV